ncbi:hypothetical protein SJ928_14000, partial [Enterococcus faecium]
GLNHVQFNSIQFNSIQFNSIQFNSIQFNFIYIAPIYNKSSLGALETQSLTPEHMATPSVARKNSLLGRNLEQNPALRGTLLPKTSRVRRK